MVSIVMPAYNEEDIIEASVREWHSEVTTKLPNSELIVVDDRSKDGTGKVLDRLAGELTGLRVLRPAQNGGHGKAVRLGLSSATQQFVFQTDSDRQHIPSEFWQLWEMKEDADFVFGIRRQRQDGGFRIFITRTMRLMNFLMWSIWVHDANCPFKLMRREPLKRVLDSVPPDSFIPMVMVSILARRMKFRVREAVVTHLPRRGGQQSLKGLIRWMKVSSHCAGELLRLRLSV